MTDHELNKLLADVAEVKKEDGSMYFDGDYIALVEDDVHTRWDPLHDHNQMALVKAGLREQGYDYTSRWDGVENKHTCVVYIDGIGYNGTHTDELRAFAEAVAKMKGGTG